MATFYGDAMDYETRCEQWASGFYLTDNIPDEYYTEWDEDEQDEFIQTHLWQPFEYWETRDVLEQIDSLAYHIRNKVYPQQSEELS